MHTIAAIDAPALQSWVANLFKSLGVADASANATAESLVDADVRGIGTHGVVRVPIYVKRLRQGLITAQPQARWTTIGSAAERLDGDNGLGQWVGQQAMLRACALARDGGIGMVLATRSNHFGTASWFARIAAAQGCAAIVFSQAESMVVPFGGTARFFGTNPFCMSVPRADDAEPIVLDMATSSVPYGKIELAKVAGSPIPAQWAVDADGKSTTDPHRVHALQPMAGPKGSGLAMLVDLLSGGLAGAVCGPRIHRMYDDFEHAHELAHTFIAIRTAGFSAARPCAEVVDEMVGDLRTQRPADGFTDVLLPGEMEARAEARNRENGLTLSATLRDSLRTLGREQGVEFPE